MKDSPESSCPDTLNKAVSLVPYAGQYLNRICHPFVFYALSLWIQCFCLPSESMQARIGYGRKLTILQSDPALTDLDVYMPFLMVQELHFKGEFSTAPICTILWGQSRVPPFCKGRVVPRRGGAGGG